MTDSISFVPCRLDQIVIDENADQQAIFIAEQHGKRRIAIRIGPAEALAIDRAVKGQEFSRPLTHDLFVRMLVGLDANCPDVRIVDLRSDVFYAELVVTSADGRETVIDCRPSDAIALLVRLPGARLSVAENVLAEAGGSM